MSAWGERHRIVVDASVGLEGTRAFRSVLTGNVVEAQPAYGAVAGSGIPASHRWWVLDLRHAGRVVLLR
jgi:hypothetical protein